MDPKFNFSTAVVTSTIHATALVDILNLRTSRVRLNQDRRTQTAPPLAPGKVC
eukprot:SAG11_NODE_12535_length_698_cov_1.280467_1_plen_52_part_01